MALIYIGWAWVAGIFLGSKLDLPLPFIFAGITPLTTLFFLRQRRKAIILASLCLIAFLGGTLRFQASLPAGGEGYLQSYNDRESVEIRGMVSGDPEIKDRTTHFRLSANEIKSGEDWRGVTGTVLVVVGRYPPYTYGDVLRVTGKLETPPRLDGFDYQAYLAHQEIYSTMFYPEIQVLDTGNGFKPLGWVYSLRNRLSQVMAMVLPEPQASLSQGILLGIRGSIPSSVETGFVHTGTVHLLAISGLHLSIVAGIVLGFGIRLFGKRGYIYIWLALSAIWLYALLTGMHPPVFRAAIMASVFLAAELFGRQRSAFTALVLAAAVMVGLSPGILWNASFQMSFTAMAGLIFIFPPVQSLGRKAVRASLGDDGTVVSVVSLIADSFSLSLAAIIAVWPLVAYHFGIISPVAPLATFFALPALPVIMVTSAAAGSLGLISIGAAQAVAWLDWLFLSYLLGVVRVFDAVPFIKEGLVGSGFMWVYYSALALIIWSGSRNGPAGLIPKAAGFVSGLPRKWVISPLVAVAILVSVTAATIPDDNLRVSFLDVGQGDAILIQKGSQQILIDGGPSPERIALALGKEMPFWDKTIDLVVATHPHADHLTGLIEVLNRYRVEGALYPELNFSSDIYDEWLGLLEEKDIKYTLAEAGQQIKMGEVAIEVLNPRLPLLSGTGADIDNNSVVLHIEMGEVSFLLTADIFREGEFELVSRRANLGSTVLKVAHHGSSTATTDRFLAVVNPELAVISVGEGNPFGHPGSTVVDRLSEKLGQEKIYRTDEHGIIEFITNGESLWVRTEN